MEFEQRRPDVVRAISQRALLAWWGRMCGVARVPATADATPETRGTQTQSMIHCDVVMDDGRQRFLMRFIGERLATAYGGDWVGRFLDEALPVGLSEATHRAYAAAVESQQPVYNIMNTPDRKGRMVHYERLVLPFSSDGSAVDHLVISVEMLSDEGAFEDKLLMARTSTSPAYLLNALIDVTSPSIAPREIAGDVFALD